MYPYSMFGAKIRKILKNLSIFFTTLKNLVIIGNGSRQSGIGYLVK